MALSGDTDVSPFEGFLNQWGANRVFENYPTWADLSGESATLGKLAIVDAVPGGWFIGTGSTWAMYGTAVFADVGARDAALPTPSTGMHARTNGTGVEWRYDGSAWRPLSTRVRPTAISNTGGTATIAADGSIDIAGATVVTLTNAFPAYATFDTDAFEVIISGTMGSAGTVSMKLASAGTVDPGTTTYDTKGLIVTQAGVSSAATALATTQWFLSNNVGCVAFEATLELRHAAETKNTRGWQRAQVVVTAGTAENDLHFGIDHRNANAFDGFQITFGKAFTGVILIKAKA